MRYGVFAAALILFLSASASAQKKTLTNDDFPSGQRPAVESKGEAKEGEGDKADEPKDEKAKAAAEKKKAEEAWQKKYEQASQKTSALDKQRTETELSAQELRNRLRRSSDPQDVEAITSQLRSAEQRLKDLNGQYDEAKKASDDMQKEATDKGFKEKEIPKVKDGKPNNEYYESKINALSEKQRLASEKIRLYQSRLNDARQKTYQSRPSDPNRVGNPYFTDPDVKKSVEEAQSEMQKAQEELDKLNEELEKLRREAKSSGVGVR